MTESDFDFTVFNRCLGRASTATIAMTLYHAGLANSVLENIQPLTGNSRFVGRAVTLRFIPARPDASPASVDNRTNPQRLALESLGENDVLVIDARGQTNAATLGGILAQRAKVLGAAALVTDGAFRDLAEIQAVGVPAFAKAASPGVSHQVHTPVDYQVPIACGGVAVYPGDILVGDQDGVVLIPQVIAMDIAVQAAKREQVESNIKALIAQGLPLQGNYPPSADHLAELENKVTPFTPQQVASSLGIEFPEQSPGYLNMCTRVGSLLMTSGHCSPATGQVGGELDIEMGKDAAKEALILLLQSVYQTHGSLNGLRFVKLLGCVNSVQNFREQHLVIHGASDLIHQIFGRDTLGYHARSALGFSGLPTGAAVELEAILEII